jgi:hypothetical protein
MEEEESTSAEASADEKKNGRNGEWGNRKRGG